MTAVEHVNDMISRDNDPLTIALGIAADTSNPPDIRLGACAIAIPVMYPRLSAAIVQSNHTVTRVDASELLDRITTRITKQGPATIEAHEVEQPPETAE